MPSTTPVNPSAFSWQGRALLTTGLALFAGRASDNRPHRHFAVQLALSAAGVVKLVDADGRIYAGGLAGCAAGTMHRLEPTEDQIIIAYLEPTTKLGAAAQKKIDGISILAASPPPNLFSALQMAIEDGLPQAAEAALHKFFGTGVAVGIRQPDLRLAALINSAAFRGVPPVLEDAAREMSISPSRFSHLFSAEMGIAYSAFRKWRKLIATLQSVAGGAQLTAAAHDGGFADSAHFSRTFKHTFGLTPTEALFHLQFSPPVATAESQ